MSFTAEVRASNVALNVIKEIVLLIIIIIKHENRVPIQRAQRPLLSHTFDDHGRIV